MLTELHTHVYHNARTHMHHTRTHMHTHMHTHTHTHTHIYTHTHRSLKLKDQAVEVVRDLIASHDSDNRFQGSEAHARISSIYLPVLSIVMDYYPQLYKGPDGWDDWTATFEKNSEVRRSVIIKESADVFEVVNPEVSGVSVVWCRCVWYVCRCVCAGVCGVCRCVWTHVMHGVCVCVCRCVCRCVWTHVMHGVCVCVHRICRMV